MRARTARISSDCYAIKCYFLYGEKAAYFNYQKIMGSVQTSFTVSASIALFYTLEQRREAEIFLSLHSKKYDIKYYSIEKM